MIILEDALLIDPSVDHPVVCTFALPGVITASSAAPGFDAEFAADPSTIKFWRPTSLPATWELEPDGEWSPLGDDSALLDDGFALLANWEPGSFDYVGIAAHDLSDHGVTVEIQIPDGPGWQTIATHKPEDNSPILFSLTNRNPDKVRLSFTGTSGVPTVGIIMIGRAAIFPQPTSYVGRTDIFDQVQEEYSTTQSEGGNFIARYVTRTGQAFNLTVSNISEEWKADVLDPLIAHLRGSVAFVADRPKTAPRSVGFGQLASRPVPEREIPNHRASVSVSMDFIGHVSS